MVGQPVARVAVVTGSSGFVATELVRHLLQRGYTVRATVRSKHSDKIAHLQALGKISVGSLQLYEADLLKGESFDKVVKGADYVFHTASPFPSHIEDPEEDVIKPARLGTLNVLKSVVKSRDTVKRVVLTSSFAAMIKVDKGPANGKLYTDADWNDESKADKATCYYMSKAVAEQAAWQFAKEHGIDLVVICPTSVFGPVISQRVDSTSVKRIKGLIENTSSAMTPWLCDVQDVARAHMLAAVTPEANGRYLVSMRREVSTKAIVEVERELGLKITPWQTSIIDMATSLISHGVAKPIEA
ncbi:hypothetical protein WJX73_009173 [Symbiochloris irregularis]|uniref:Flavanone 4-reductase n=1 Tax=Symbiochloris irregularis TaxID=706552 RepID=A0AAW1PV37_9CHLO